MVATGYGTDMVTKRSVSLDASVAEAVEQAAVEDGVSFSAWLSAAAERQLAVRAGLRGVAAWEERAGPLSDEEIAEGDALLARLLSGVAARVRPGVAAMVRQGTGAKSRRR